MTPGNRFMAVRSAALALIGCALIETLASDGLATGVSAVMQILKELPANTGLLWPAAGLKALHEDRFDQTRAKFAEAKKVFDLSQPCLSKTFETLMGDVEHNDVAISVLSVAAQTSNLLAAAIQLAKEVPNQQNSNNINRNNSNNNNN